METAKGETISPATGKRQAVVGGWAQGEEYGWFRSIAIPRR